ncbi:nucleoplasmin isoform 1-like protein [Penaeus vannamei]|uniref:Nucleoplasmin isoform 1-like protein n=1 Tax=Penaeus vannamei TaxID=6689 RepID=A0A423T9I4_PENVA|nr:nucleoplasmin isoform 1-like protein [Penaeus vannamei]
MRGMEKTYFWGLTLDGSTKEKTWEGQCVLNNLEATTTTHTLSIRQVVLGPEAKEGEVNVVELEVKGYKDQKHKIPVCVTKAGGSYVTGVDVLIEDTPAIFRLTQGSGPIHLTSVSLASRCLSRFEYLWPHGISRTLSRHMTPPSCLISFHSLSPHDSPLLPHVVSLALCISRLMTPLSCLMASLLSHDPSLALCSLSCFAYLASWHLTLSLSPYVVSFALCVSCLMASHYLSPHDFPLLPRGISHSLSCLMLSLSLCVSCLMASHYLSSHDSPFLPHGISLSLSRLMTSLSCLILSLLLCVSLASRHLTFAS